jgi:ATP-dependent Clp protease ATP-binding subunit ClpC
MSRLVQGEREKLLRLEDTLHQRVVGQDEAVQAVAEAIQRSRAGIQDPNRPIGSFLFLGPTGVGKTELAKTLAQALFDDENNLVRIDVSEYMEKLSVSRLIGAPPGYVGYEEGGQLTERVRRRPYSIVLLDEIEKAHTDVFNLLLQVMDEGRLTDSYGRTVDFRNTIVIMTSNVGTRELKDFGTGIGFAKDERAGDKQYSRDVIQKALNKRFAPEFINRIDEIINFDQLGKDAIVNIVDLELAHIVKRITELGYTIELTTEAKQFLADKGYDIQYGARPLKRALQNYVEDEISGLLLDGQLQAGDTIHVTAENDKLKFDVKR